MYEILMFICVTTVVGWAISVINHLIAIRKRLDQLADKLLR